MNSLLHDIEDVLTVANEDNEDDQSGENQNKKKSRGRPKTSERTMIRGLTKEFKESLDKALSALTQYGVTRGFTREEISQCISVLCSSDDFSGINYFATKDDTVFTTIVKSLVPVGEVDEIDVIQLMGVFADASLVKRKCILVWLLVIFERLLSLRMLQSIYSVFFHYLDYDVLRPLLCHILFHLTRRDHVKPFRIRRLYDLHQRSCGGHHGVADKPLLALLTIYKHYYPHLVSLPAVSSLSSAKEDSVAFFFKNPDKTMYAQLCALQLETVKLAGDRAANDAKLNGEDHLKARTIAESVALANLSGESRAASELMLPSQRHRVISRGVIDYETVFAKTSNDSINNENSFKKRRLALIPTIQTTIARDSVDVAGVSTRSVAEVSSVRALASTITTLQLPDQLASVLQNRYLQHAISLDPSAATLGRIANWLHYRLEEEFLWHGGEVTDKAINVRDWLMNGLVSFSRFVRETSPGFARFLYTFLTTWDGVTYSSQLLEVLSFLDPLPFGVLNHQVFKPMLRHFIQGPLSLKVRILECYTSILKRWASVDWLNYINNESRSPFILDTVDRSVNWMSVLHQFCQNLDRFCFIGLHLENGHLLMLNAVISVFETIAELPTRFNLPFIVLPCAGVAMACLLSSCAMTISRMAGIFVRYKLSFENLKKNPPPIPGLVLSFDNGLSEIRILNNYIMDFSNCLWRLHAFTPSERSKSVLFSTPRICEDRIIDAIKFQGLHKCLSITHSMAFSSLCWEFLKVVEKEQHGNNDSRVLKPHMVKDNVRVLFVDFLRQRGLHGLYSFLYTFQSSLVKK